MASFRIFREAEQRQKEIQRVQAMLAKSLEPIQTTIEELRRAQYAGVLQLRQMDTYEYQRFYDTGAMPERFWPSEIEILKVKYVAEKITLDQFEDELEGLMGFPA